MLLRKERLVYDFLQLPLRLAEHKILYISARAHNQIFARREFAAWGGVDLLHIVDQVVYRDLL